MPFPSEFKFVHKVLCLAPTQLPSNHHVHFPTPKCHLKYKKIKYDDNLSHAGLLLCLILICALAIASFLCMHFFLV
uniref:Uncharacterized protein n=1 Tax=Triticum urartu TaxID=4572 RepID=A0A8R7PZX3_TRIUA